MKFKKIKQIFIVLLFCFSVAFLPFIVKAQTNTEVLERKAQLEKELLDLEKEIQEKEDILNGQKNKSASLGRDIEILKTKISKTKLSIKSQNLIIEKINKEIKNKEKTITDLGDKIGREKDSLAQLIKKTNELDSAPLLNILLSTQSLSTFYGDFNSFLSIKKSINESVQEVKISKGQNEKAKEELKKKQDEEMDAKVKLEAEQKKVEKNQKEQKTLLSISKNKEKEYEALLKEKQKKAAEIRSALFALRDTKAIPFGDALEFALLAQKKTGVRPALVLAILTQESNMGENVGTCNREGDPINKKWQAIMPGPLDIAQGKSKRDDESAFLRITGALGLNPDTTPLSCPMASGGWGGAMGPSQFIPTTWELFKNKIANALNLSVANPWEPKHAIMATSIYMSELGADNGGYTAERNAACRYYSGRPCGSGSMNNTFYGNSVLKIAQNIQENMIDPLQDL